jgi:hypothetical protein
MRAVEGGIAGNYRLTAMTGALLLVLFALELATTPFLSSLRVEHVFIGFVLVPVVSLKVASTFYRFVRYYTGSEIYRAAGPPVLVLRVLGPVVILSSVVLIGSGVVLIIVGHGHSLVYTVHVVSFVVWAAAMGVHVLGHLRTTARVAPADRRERNVPGARQRRAAIGGCLVAGLVLGLVTLPLATGWHHRRHRFDERGGASVTPTRAPSARA